MCNNYNIRVCASALAYIFMCVRMYLYALGCGRPRRPAPPGSFEGGEKISLSTCLCFPSKTKTLNFYCFP